MGYTTISLPAKILGVLIECFVKLTVEKQKPGKSAFSAFLEGALDGSEDGDFDGFSEDDEEDFDEETAFQLRDWEGYLGLSRL